MQKMLKAEGELVIGRHRPMSDVLCACGCGQPISRQAARNKARGKPNAGYVHGHVWKGRTLPEAARAKMRANHADVSGERNPNYGKGLFGETNPNWQGGKTRRYVKHNPPGANCLRDLAFRARIRERDGHCVLCGSTEALHAHHIEPWMEREDLRFDEHNVVTLCRPCHARADNVHHRDRIKPTLLAHVRGLSL